jgi:hypothetical protein
MFTQVPPTPVQAWQTPQPVAQQWLSMQATEHWLSVEQLAPLASLQSMSCPAAQDAPHGAQTAGQKPSDVALHGRVLDEQTNVQREGTPLRVLIVLASPTQSSYWVWQTDGGSQLSPASTTPLPQVGEQSLSLLALQPGGQQESPFAQAVFVPAFTHAAVQAVPCNVRSWQPTGGQLVGQLAPSHVSPQAGSVTPLPHSQLQSLSLVVLQAGGQQLSPLVQVEIIAPSTHFASQVEELPCRTRRWQPTAGQLVGQLPSQVSPASTTPFPQWGVQSLSVLALQAAGQQPSPFTHAVCWTSSTHWAWQESGLASRRNVQPTCGQVVGQLDSGSQCSPQAVSIAPLPHWQVQSLSSAVVQPGGQHESPLTHAVSVPVCAQRAVQVSALPSRPWISQPIRGQLVGQVPGGSQVSPGSSLPLPHVGPPPSEPSPSTWRSLRASPEPAPASASASASASANPDDTAASTRRPMSTGERFTVQPTVWQQTPMGTEALAIRSHV